LPLCSSKISGEARGDELAHADIDSVVSARIKPKRIGIRP
jgi:hypothetical protein